MRPPVIRNYFSAGLNLPGFLLVLTDKLHRNLWSHVWRFAFELSRPYPHEVDPRQLLSEYDFHVLSLSRTASEQGRTGHQFFAGLPRLRLLPVQHSQKATSGREISLLACFRIWLIPAYPLTQAMSGCINCEDEGLMLQMFGHVSRPHGEAPEAL